MILEQWDEGDFCIYGGAIEAAQGNGYIAAVVVHQVRNTHPSPREVFRDHLLACGHQWPSHEAAIAYAMDKGRAAVRAAQHRIAC